VAELPQNVYLVGPMGSGKTSLGRRVARDLGLSFVDCDEEIVRRTGASVNLIFDIEGERGFRKREKDMLRELSERRGTLVATGGGAVLDPDNRALLRRTGLVVWLRTSVQQQLRRLELDRNRPLLQTADRRQRLEALARERDPLYDEAAHFAFSGGQRNLKAAAVALTEAIQRHRDQHRERPHAQP
jgi:shikimate kinase